MLSVAEALEIVLGRCGPLPSEVTRILPDGLGLVLAEDVCTDLDVPPFDKAMMDGYAVLAADLAGGGATLRVAGEQMAGQAAPARLGAGEAVRIMTGAPIPAGADAVVMVERTRLLDGNRVEVHEPRARPGLNVLPRGREMRAGDVAVGSGTLLRPPEIGLLATVGRTEVRAVPPPRVAVAATGDEVVEPAQAPGPSQIRNSNGPLLTAQVLRAGGRPEYLGIARDVPADLKEVLRRGLEADVLAVSGGVSAGDRDLVPGTLRELGVEAHFHKVAMKPGKPVLFGSRGGTLVFGLPGNPVSAFVCFELFVRPALARLGGHSVCGPETVTAALAEDVVHRSDRPTYHPAVVRESPSGNDVWLVPWFGSADLRGLARANALAVLPPGEHHLARGTAVPVLRTDGGVGTMPAWSGQDRPPSHGTAR